MLDLNKYWKNRGFMTEQKYIALIDCDSFFVSCERKLNPKLNAKPVCVVSGARGCVIARSIEAKEMGIPMGHPLFMAQKEFPKAIYINANHYNYAKISDQVMSFLKQFSPTVEVYSIDEAFVDLTGISKLYKKNYYNLAKYIRDEIAQQIGIPVSVGVSRTKALAKLASDKSKTTEDHVYIAGKQGLIKLLKESEIGEIWGIGRRLEPKLRGHGIYTAYDYVQKNDAWLKSRFGKLGLELKYELLGNQINKISTITQKPKSIMDTKSFPEFSTDLNYLKNELMIHIHSACRKLRRADCKCKTIGVIIKTKEFQTIYEKIDLELPTNFEFEISERAIPILEKLFNPNIIYRSIGILLENFNDCSNQQISIFDDNQKREKNEKLARSLDKLEAKFGRNIVTTGFTGSVEYKQDFISK
jgi:nucleotidyltransferase/DNA polymerase involved in DNA repair